jgi:DNA polymerase elongation subunit (family B)
MIKDKSKVLIFDVETSPNLAYVWGKWKQNIYSPQFVEKSYLMSFAAKWLGDDEIIYVDNRNNDDRALVKTLYDLLDEADLVVAHNGDKFDLPTVLGRGIVHGYKPPSPYHSVDTLKVARKKFRFLSNSLADLCVELGLPLKGDHKKFAGFQLWVQCLKQNDEAWDEMREYNIQDIQSLEALYLRLRPYISGHPNVGVDEVSCPSCGSLDLQKRGLYKPKSGLVYQRYQCNCCGSWSKGKSSLRTETNNIRSI